MSKAWQGGSTRRWRRVRAAVLQRDQGRCQVQGQGCTGAATTVDHIVPRSLGGGDALDNLRASCQWCNASRGNETRTNPRPRRISRW